MCPVPSPPQKKLNTVLYTNNMAESGFLTLGECVFVFAALNMEMPIRINIVSTKDFLYV